MRKITVFLGATFLLAVICKAEEGLLEKLASGFKFAGKLLGIDHVSEVTQLISKAFANTKRTESNDDAGNNIFSNFLRLFGFDSKKLAAITVNGIILMAQLISSSLTRITPKGIVSARELDTENPFVWASNSSKVQNILEDVKNADLPRQLVDYIKEHSLDEDTDCIQLLVCKLSPFVKKMQQSLKDQQKNKPTGREMFFKYVPSVEELEEAGDICEEKHPYCRIIY